MYRQDTWVDGVLDRDSVYAGHCGSNVISKNTGVNMERPEESTEKAVPFVVSLRAQLSWFIPWKQRQCKTSTDYGEIRALIGRHWFGFCG